MPILLIVGENDSIVVDLNRQAADVLTADVETKVVAGATHLFEEPGALDSVIAETIEALHRWQSPR